MTLDFQMSDFEALRQAVFNLIAEHEDVDVLLQEVSRRRRRADVRAQASASMPE